MKQMLRCHGFFLLGLLLLTPVAQAGFDEGVAAANAGDFDKAFAEFSALAEKGDARAQQSLGWMYYEGQGRDVDYAKAAYWYGKAAEQGSVTSQINLAQMYAYGQGVEQDFSKAAHWWRKLAEQGDARSQAALGGLYYQGKGVEQDLAEAARLWEEAAKQGHMQAQLNLGLMYGKGEGVVQDDAQAYAWLTAAAVQGNEIANSSREFALQQLDEAGRARAEDLADEYVRRYAEPFMAAEEAGKGSAPNDKKTAH